MLIADSKVGKQFNILLLYLQSNFTMQLVSSYHNIVNNFKCWISQ